MEFRDWKFIVFIILWGSFSWSLLRGAGRVISFVILALIILAVFLRRRKLSEIVICTNCHNRMTLRRFKECGCIVCGSDLYRRTGEHAQIGD